MITSDKVANVYAEALMALASEKKALQETFTELQGIVETVTKEPATWSFFRSPLISPEDKVSIIEKSMKGKVSVIVFDFVRVLALRKRLDSLPAIAVAFSTLLDQANGLRRVEVSSTTGIDAADLAAIQKMLADHFKKEVVLIEKKNPELLGGFVIRSGDLMIDMSLQSGLRTIGKKMLAKKLVSEDYYEN